MLEAGSYEHVLTSQITLQVELEDSRFANAECDPNFEKEGAVEKIMSGVSNSRLSIVCSRQSFSYSFSVRKKE